jgi:hypothetical protein
MRRLAERPANVPLRRKSLSREVTSGSSSLGGISSGAARSLAPHPRVVAGEDVVPDEDQPGAMRTMSRLGDNGAERPTRDTHDARAILEIRHAAAKSQVEAEGSDRVVPNVRSRCGASLLAAAHRATGT